MIKLEDLTKEYIYSELKNNYKEFEDIEILENVYFQGPHRYKDSHGIADTRHSGSDLYAIEYLVKHDKEDILEGMQLSLRVKNSDSLRERVTRLRELHKSSKHAEFEDDASREKFIEFALSTIDADVWSFNHLCNLLNYYNYNSNCKIAMCYAKCKQLSESSIRISVVLSNQTMHTTPIPWAIQHLAEIKDLLSNVLTYAKDNHLPQIEKIYLEALDIFEGVNDELVSYFKNFDIDTFLTKEFYICDVELPEPITSDIADEIDKVSALCREDIYAYEILDPVRSDMFLARPKTLVQELQKLCNMTIVKRYNKQNENLPNVISSAEAKEQLLDELSKHANSARNWVYKHLNERFEAAPNRSRERKILKHFKESTAPFNDKIISIYERDIKDYVETPFNQRLDYYLSKAFTTDLQNGNNNEKLRIIGKVSSAIDEIEQLVKQLNSAYRDMLVHLYSDEES